MAHQPSTYSIELAVCGLGSWAISSRQFPLLAPSVHESPMARITPRSMVAFCILAIACNNPRLERHRDPPTLAPLQTITVIEGSDSFVPSGVASTRACDLVLVGAEWGSVTRVPADGSLDPKVARIPGARRVSRLEDGDESNLVVWSQSPPFLGRLNGNDMTIDSIGVPLHAWGDHWVGPVAALPTGHLAMTPMGVGPARRQPEPWVAAPLIQVLDSDGRVVQTVGEVENQGGHYLSWLAARAWIGNTGDTLLVLSFSTGKLSAYAPVTDRSTPSTHWSKQLPIYFQAPSPHEEIWRAPWIQIGGEMPHLIEVSHVADAAFGSDGKLYVIRNYMAEWRRARNRYVSTQGAWAVTEQGLEIYDAHGHFLGAYALPDMDVNWLRADRHGRLFFSVGSGSIIVAQDPTSPPSPCPALPPRVILTAADTPPGARTVASNR